MPKSYANEIFDKIKPEKKERIIRSAMTEFANFGLVGANINNIAKNAEVSVGSLYKYFDNKEDLFLHLVSLNVLKMQEVQKSIVAMHLPVLETIKRIISEIITSSKPNEVELQFYNVMTTENNNEFVFKIASEMEGASAEIYTNLIRRGQESGEISRRLSPEYIAFFIDNLFVQLQFALTCEYYKDRMKFFIGNPIDQEQKDLIEQLYQFIKHAIT